MTNNVMRNYKLIIDGIYESEISRRWTVWKKLKIQHEEIEHICGV